MNSYLYPDSSLNLTQSHFPVVEPQTTLGRHPNNHVSVLVESISRFHAKIEKEGNHFFLTDLGSSNGSFLNGQRLTGAAKLADGDTITLGKVDLTFSFVPPQHWTEGKRSNLSSSSSVSLLSDDDSSSMILSTQDGKDSTPFTSSIRNIKNREALEVATAKLLALYRMNDLLRTATDEDEVLQILADVVFDTVDCDRLAVLMVCDRETLALESRQVRSREGAEVGSSFSVSRTIVDKSLRERVAILSRDARVDSRFSSSESIIISDIRSAMCVPLISHTNLIGVLFVDSREAVKKFTDDDLAFVGNLAADVAISIDNIALAQQTLQNERLAAVGQTIAGLAHNIKNILQLAKGGMELMDGAVQRKSLSELEQFWPIVRRGIDRMQSLTKEMLDYSRQTAPRLVVADVNHVVQDLISAFQKDTVREGIEIKVELSPNLPNRKIDPDGLAKAIMNLLSNAIDALEDRSGGARERSGQGRSSRNA